MFDPTEVAHGAPITRDFAATPGNEMAYESFPPSVFSMAETIWVSGMGMNWDHIRAMVRYTTGTDVPVSVLRLHFSRNFDRCMAERNEHLRGMHEAAAKMALEQQTDVQDLHAQTQAMTMGAALDAMLLEMIMGKRSYSLKDLQAMADTAAKIQKIDPRHEGKSQQAKKRYAREIAAETAQGFQEGLDAVQDYKQSTGATGALVDEYMSHTERILEDVPVEEG